MVSGIETIVTQHFKMFFRDMNNQPFNKVHSRNAFGDVFIVFMSGVVKGYVFTIIFVNTGSGNDRTTKISGDIFYSNIRGTEIRLCPDIETVSMKGIHLIFDSAERRAESFCKFLKKNFSESITQEVIVEMFNRTPGCDITGTALGNKSVYVRIPLKIPTESVKDTDNTGSKDF